MDVPLIVKFKERSINVRANPDWSVFQLKQHIYLHCFEKAENLKIIFAGTEVSDNVLLKNCHFTQGTVLHSVVVRQSTGQQGNNKSVISTQFCAPTAEGIKVQTAKNRNQRRSHFYVYCKEECNGVKPGKLRVQCRRCKNQGFELEKGPESWEDVLTPNKISGHCNNSSGCNGDTAEFYFKCATVHAKRTSVMALSLLRTNTKNIPCMLCYDVSEIILVFQCTNSHVICVGCFARYVESKLDGRQFVLSEEIGYSVSCPGMEDDCNESFIKDVHHFLLAGKNQYERFKNFATEEFVLQNGGILCPGEGCGNGLMPEDETTRRIVCFRNRGGCGLTFCRECQNPYHDGGCATTMQERAQANTEAYQVDRTRAQQARWLEEANSSAAIDRLTKRCPGCRRPTEKNGGCNHMTCTQCRCEWCWLCHVTWSGNCQADHWFRAG